MPLDPIDPNTFADIPVPPDSPGCNNCRATGLSLGPAPAAGRLCCHDPLAAAPLPANDPSRYGYYANRFRRKMFVGDDLTQWCQEISWQVAGEQHVAEIRFELFARATVQPAPLWAKRLDFSAAPAPARGSTPFAGDLQDLAGLRQATGNPQVAIASQLPAAFTTPFLTEAAGPYKLKMTVVPQSGCTTDRPSVWIYLDVIEEGLFGIELTFTNDCILCANQGSRVRALSVLNTYLLRWRDTLRVRPNLVYEQGHDDKGMTHKFTFPDGWWYQVGLDDGVAELSACPLTLREAKYLANRIRLDIFSLARDLRLGPTAVGAKQDARDAVAASDRWRQVMQQKNYLDLLDTAGLEPGTTAGSGHLHLDVLTHFQGDQLLFRDFLVDYSNHASLGVGGFGLVPTNPSIAMNGPLVEGDFVAVVGEFDGGQHASIDHLTHEVSTRVHDRTWSGRVPAQKYQALNLRRIAANGAASGGATIEIRACRPQRGAADLCDMLELYQERLRWLKAERAAGRISAYTPSAAVWDWEALRAGGDQIRKLPTNRRDAAIDQFYSYVVDTGLSWNRYKPMLPASLLSRARADNPVHI